MSQTQKKYANYISIEHSIGVKGWDIIKQDRLKKLNSVRNIDLIDLISSIPKARLDMWCQLNDITISKNNERHILYKAIMQSWLACQTRELHPDITFHRNIKAEFTDKIYKHLFYKLEPKLEVAEEICKYLDF